ncbi:MAG: hypothetical protein HYZ84_06700 [Candidatus Omnitrophica bacterium]|nr:hypothetical protein [Candidatus Omnitrophota bacterium]
MKKLTAFLIMFVFFVSNSASASPWAEEAEYFPRIFGKLGFGLKNSLLGWSEIFIQPTQPKYKTDWEGFCVGMAAALVETGNGLIHLVTFPIPVDVPDIGRGVHIPKREVDRSNEHPKLEAAMQKAVERAAGKPVKAIEPEAEPAPSPAESPVPAETVPPPVPATVSAEISTPSPSPISSESPAAETPAPVSQDLQY